MNADRLQTGAAFFVEVRSDPPCATVTVFGEVDLACHTDLEASLQEALAAKVSTVVLELSNVTFIDLAGTRAIIEFHQRCDRQGPDVRLVPSPAVDRVLNALEELGEFGFGLRERAS